MSSRKVLGKTDSWPSAGPTGQHRSRQHRSTRAKSHVNRHASVKGRHRRSRSRDEKAALRRCRDRKAHPITSPPDMRRYGDFRNVTSRPRTRAETTNCATRSASRVRGDGGQAHVSRRRYRPDATISSPDNGGRSMHRKKAMKAPRRLPKSRSSTKKDPPIAADGSADPDGKGTSPTNCRPASWRPAAARTRIRTADSLERRQRKADAEIGRVLAGLLV